MITATQGPDGTITFDDGGNKRQLRLVLDATDSSMPRACIQTFPGEAAPEATAWTDQLARFHMTNSGGRIAADFPACGGGSAIIGNWPAETGNHVTNG